jgi:hypothetical protein
MIEMRKDKKCINCAYSSFVNIVTPDRVYCNRFPPTIDTGFGIYMPIQVNAEWHCGEYKNEPQDTME